MSLITAKQFQKLLLAWFDTHGRKHLPWQQRRTPYRVWVSEIMLQQTQVATVIPYFERYMKTFPDVKRLAQAPVDDVLHLWAGLGYYSRARNLHRAAQLVMTEFAGTFPDTLEGLMTLPGVGRSTAGAIQAIAFGLPGVILDGNVKRVLARFHGITTPVNEKMTESKLWSIAENYMPDERTADYTQAMMDLGATLCTRAKPRCESCPFSRRCVAYKQGLTAQIPAKKTAKKIPTKEATFIILKRGSEVLLCKRPPIGIWGGLYSLPEIAGQPDAASIRAFCRQHFQVAIQGHQLLPSFRHTFSHYHLQIFPVMIEVKRAPTKVMEGARQIWYNPDKPEAVGLPKPVQSILGTLP